MRGGAFLNGKEGRVGFRTDSTVGRLHPLPFWKGRGLGSGLRTLPLGRDRWGKYSTVGRLHPLVPEVSVPYKGNRRGRKDY